VRPATNDRAVPGDRPERRSTAWIQPGDLRVGVLGGTFDPIHLGHLAIADQVRAALRLDRVLFVPAARPPHKMNADVSPAADRAAMVALAIAGNPAFAMCEIELHRDGPSYTVDTLGELADEAARQGVARDLYFILSVEALAGFKRWHEPARLLELARLAVVARPGAPLPDPRRLASMLPGGAAAADRVECVETFPSPVSASGVRSRVASGRAIDDLVPPAVAAYIRDHRLYRSDTPGGPPDVTDESTSPAGSSTETTPSPDGLPRRRKPAVGEAALADALEAAVEAEAGAEGAVEEPAIEESLRERGARLSALEVARKIVDAAEDKKAADIVLLDVSELTSMADYFVICSGGSERQLGAIGDGITEKLREEGVRPIGREGGSNSHWTLVDFGAVIVHIFAPPERDYYQLERHWSKAKTILRVQ
jgi:nicotinate-nucleotide adenylyltransferase